MGSFTDSRPKNRMSQIGACFVEAGERLAARPDISVSSFGSAFAGQALIHLGEDEPHPTGRLWLAATLANSGKNTVEGAVLILGLNEAVEIEGIGGRPRVRSD